jgi:hypothetical protein
LALSGRIFCGEAVPTSPENALAATPLMATDLAPSKRSRNGDGFSASPFISNVHAAVRKLAFVLVVAENRVRA